MLLLLLVSNSEFNIPVLCKKEIDASVLTAMSSVADDEPIVCLYLGHASTETQSLPKLRCFMLWIRK
jgi:hypothetical protein